ncbi:beta-ketoacyl-ACP synthase III [Kitasatospora kifunensis]|uniref:Beta-ketoacyl-[acyl-carrier-protein] synthase III n=1 Tax=Kitasatospora kifunensis TaxID=58351 RepID=A0A7W7QY94_KITKI|nr:beta-ketoacyl-ACP synthase III [Kitasatospora kifunensis]MBB4922008.1 3-oxoacyl-[acyl-carrier-protein] synthase-3 [Kitasatospora kifunensis]
MSRAAVVAGLGSWVPPTVVSNAELAAQLDTSDEWIRTRTGIRQRHVIEPGSATGDLAVAAGRRALASAGVDGADLVVLATSTPDQPCPATAPEVASRLGLTGVGAFDVAAVCTGFVYALATAAGLLATGVGDSALVIGADTFSTILDPADRTTRAIFGDGAGAVLLRAGEPGELGALNGFVLGSDGTRRELIEVPAGGSRQRSTGRPADPADTYFAMQGKPVFAEAVAMMASSIRTTTERMGWSVAQIDHFVLHQANARILAAVAQRLEVPLERFVSNIERVGNTVAASIPLAMADAAREGRLGAGQRVVLAGFGGGLTWGSTALTWPDLKTV